KRNQEGSVRFKHQGVAQLAAHLVRDEEVAGAGPATLTTKGSGVTAARQSPKLSGVRANRAAPARRTLPTYHCSTFPTALGRSLAGAAALGSLTPAHRGTGGDEPAPAPALSKPMTA